MRLSEVVDSLIEGLKATPGNIVGAPADIGNLALGLATGKGTKGFVDKPIGGSKQINSFFGIKEAMDPVQAGTEIAASFVSPGVAAKSLAMAAPFLRRSYSLFNAEELNKAASLGYKSREKLIDMDPSEFLKLAEQGYSAEKYASVKAAVEKGIPLSDIPYLQIEKTGPTTYSVGGHEGRHRAMVLRDLGYDSMPVRLSTDTLRWSEQADPQRFDYRALWPENLQAQTSAANPDFFIKFPVTREESILSYIKD